MQTDAGFPSGSRERRLETGRLAQRSPQRGTGPSRPRVAVVIAGNVNYYYNTIGKRLAEALRNLGAVADVATLGTFEPRDYECCFLAGLGEIVAGHKDERAALRRIHEIRDCSKFTAVWNFESMDTCWFAQTQRLLGRVKYDVLVDTNIHDQRWLVPRKLRGKHHFVFYGLTHSEREQLRRQRHDDETEERPIPWVMVGHATDNRIALAERLLREVHPSGFVYLGRLSPVTESGPHLKERQYQSVLRRSRFHVWCCHHDAFYAEGERFRVSALCGGVPIKILHRAPPAELVVPFLSFMLPETDFPNRMRAMDFSEARRQFLDEYERLPTLESELARFFDTLRTTGQLRAGLMRLDGETRA